MRGPVGPLLRLPLAIVTAGALLAGVAASWSRTRRAQTGGGFGGDKRAQI